MLLLSVPDFYSRLFQTVSFVLFIIKDLFFNEINLLTDDINKETGFLYDQLDSTIKR